MAIINYPGPHPSINASIAAANSGDTVQITAGTYNEAIVFGGGDNGISLIGNGNVVIDGGYTLPGGVLVSSVQPEQGGTHPCITGDCVPDTCTAEPSVYGGLLQINGATNIVIEGIHLTNSLGRGISMDGGSNILVQDVEISNSMRSAIVAEGGGSNFTGQRLDIHDNILYKAWDAEFPFWPIAVGSKQFDGFNILNSDIYRNWGEGLSFDRDTTNILFDGNRIWDNWALQLYVHNATNAVVRNNIIWHSGDETFDRGCNPSGGIVINTEAFLIDDGAAPSSNIDIYNNLAFMPSDALSIWNNENYSTSDDVQIFNNTFVGYGGGTPMNTQGSSGMYSNSGLYNNIFYTVDGSPVDDGSTLDPGFTQVGNNLWGNGPSGGNMSGAGDITGNPLLSNPPPSIAVGSILNPADFHLTTGSTAINSGVPGPATDYLGNARINTDIGFHEFDALANNPPTVDAANQASTAGDTISYQPTGIDPDGDALAWSASGLPPALSINPTTGLISGTVTTAGTYGYTVTVDDGINPPVSDSATWVVNFDNPPSGSGYKLYPFGCGAC